VGAARRIVRYRQAGRKLSNDPAFGTKRKNCATRWPRWNAPANGCWSALPRRRTKRWRERRHICDCRIDASAAASSRGSPSPRRTLGEGFGDPQRYVTLCAVLCRKHLGAGRRLERTVMDGADAVTGADAILLA